MKASSLLEVARLVATAVGAPDAVPDWLSELCDVVGGQLVDTSAWDRLHARPDDPDGHRALAAELNRQVTNDPEFARQLTELLHRTKPERTDYQAAVQQEFDAHVGHDLNGRQEIINTNGNDNTVISRARSVRVKNDHSRRRRITFLSLGITLAGGTTAAVVLVPGLFGGNQAAANTTPANGSHTKVTTSASTTTTPPFTSATPTGTDPVLPGPPIGGGPPRTTTHPVVPNPPPGNGGPQPTQPQNPVPPQLAVTTDQTRALPGSSFNVTGTGYGGCPNYGNHTVNVLWDGQTMGVTAPIQADGTFAAHVDVPGNAAVGDHAVYGQCVDGGNWARAVFTVPPPLAVTVTPTTGSAGDRVTVTGTGYDGCPNYGDRTVYAEWDIAGDYVTVNIQPDGTFTATISVPGSASPGDHFIYGQCRDGGQWARAVFTVTAPG